MIVSSLAGFGPFDAAVGLQRHAPARAAQAASTRPATRVSLGGSQTSADVYSDPRARPGFVRLWATPVGQDDNVSALMSRNRSFGAYALNEQWRGLGGALLKRFAETGANYAQTLVDEADTFADDEVPGMAPEDRARQLAAIQARQVDALASVATNAPTARMTIQTRSGQSVELQIAVSAGVNGILGMKVEISASGTMSDAERAAIAQLADGLDRALEGLGRQDAAVLDLSGLMGYDHDVLASLDVTVSNPQTHQPLGSFALHLGDDRRTVALKGSDGEMNLGVDAAAAPGLQRDAAIQRALDRIGSAGERGRANAALVQQMKAAFKDFQSAAAVDDEDAPAEPEASGLADFEASLGGRHLAQ